MNFCHCAGYADYGPDPYVMNVEQIAMQNANFRTTVWTGNHLQMTLMCILPCGEIGMEIHEATDQLILIESGMAVVKIGKYRSQMDFQRKICKGDAVFIPAGNWHNIINTGRNPLKLCSVYAPPNHPKGTIHKTKEDALMEE